MADPKSEAKSDATDDSRRRVDDDEAKAAVEGNRGDTKPEAATANSRSNIFFIMAIFMVSIEKRGIAYGE
jgi:hypothetical protein